LLAPPVSPRKPIRDFARLGAKDSARKCLHAAVLAEDPKVATDYFC
jgi:hypothetical protein